MQFASIRIITDDLDRLVSFYEQVTGVTAERAAPPFAEFVMPSATLAIGHSQTVGLFGAGSARAADNHSVIIEFRVDDVDAERARLENPVEDWIQEPTTMPWGNPLHPVPRPRRKPRQPVHTCLRGSNPALSRALTLQIPSRHHSGCDCRTHERRGTTSPAAADPGLPAAGARRTCRKP